MSLPAAGPDPGRPDGNHDSVLADYQALRAQETLFDSVGGFPEGPAVPPVPGSTGYDEFVESNGEVRPAWRELADLIAVRGPEGLARLRGSVRELVDNDGITYIEVDHLGETVTDGQNVAVPGPWKLDGLPLVLSATDWDIVESAVVQRSRLLDAVLDDLYGEQRCISGGILPPQLLFGHPGYIRCARGISNPGRHQLFLLGCDLSRAADGRFRVNADWTQAPSGVGYALADRRVVARAMPDAYERIGPRPASPFAQALRLALIDAAPATAEDPVVVVLSPGIHSETAFDQAYLATVLGFPLVESDDLVVREGALWMRSLGALKRVDVVLRRVDAEYSDPLDLRPDSRLGVAGLVEIQRRGAVTVVNTLGSGILESPGVQRFLPEMAGHLLGESPLLETPQLFWAGDDGERSHLLARLSDLLVRSAVGGETIVGPALSAAQREELAARIDAEPWKWVGQELPQFSSAPTCLGSDRLSSACVGMRFFTVAQRSAYTPMVGGLGYVVAPGFGAFKLNSVAAKDIWIRPPTRPAAERPVLSLLPSELPSGTQFISSPRVLSDMFWIGRYAERAEGMARLLIVTRERYHEYHYRLEVPGSECLPVLLSALRRITGMNGGDGTGSAASTAQTVADGPRILASLTVDRQQPGSLSHSVERLVLAARAVRDQMSNDTWMILGGVERALSRPQAASPVADDTEFSAAQQRTLAGMLALSGVTAESMVHDAGWTMMDVGKRIERALALAALLRATLTVTRPAEAERTITESALVACESSVIYRRLNLGRVSIEAVANLVLFDEENPRSLAYQLNRLRDGLRVLPGSSRAERLVGEISSRLRRIDPDDLEQTDAEGRRVVLDELLADVDTGLTELSDVISDNQLSLPGAMQPLWGPDQRRLVP